MIVIQFHLRNFYSEKMYFQYVYDHYIIFPFQCNCSFVIPVVCNIPSLYCYKQLKNNTDMTMNIL